MQGDIRVGARLAVAPPDAVFKSHVGEGIIVEQQRLLDRMTLRFSRPVGFSRTVGFTRPVWLLTTLSFGGCNIGKIVIANLVFPSIGRRAPTRT